jgi:hypothetical protein
MESCEAIQMLKSMESRNISIAEKNKLIKLIKNVSDPTIKMIIKRIIKNSFYLEKDRNNFFTYICKDDPIKDYQQELLIPSFYSFINEYILHQTYTNIPLVSFLQEKINEFKKVDLNKFDKKIVLYICVNAYSKDPLNRHRIMIDIDYSYDIINKIKSFDNIETKCYLFALKQIDHKDDILNFFTLVEGLFSHVIVKQKRTFIFDENVYNHFMMLPQSKKPLNDIIYTDVEPIYISNDIDEFIKKQALHNMTEINTHSSQFNDYFDKQLFNTTQTIVNYKDTINECTQYYSYLSDLRKSKLTEVIEKMKNDHEIEMLKIKNDHEINVLKIKINMQDKERIHQEKMQDKDRIYQEKMQDKDRIYQEKMQDQKK